MEAEDKDIYKNVWGYGRGEAFAHMVGLGKVEGCCREKRDKVTVGLSLVEVFVFIM